MVRHLFQILVWIGLLSSVSQSQTLLQNPDLQPFYHGVASGDPTSDAVIIWTRFTPDLENEEPVEIEWTVYADVDLQQQVQSGTFTTSAERDHTVKVDVTGLEPSSYYYYQFKDNEGRTSMVGRTKTAPSGSMDNIRFAGASCSSLYSGYFNAYRRIAERSDIDAVIHVGDYIYDFFDRNEQIRIPDDETLDVIDWPEGLEGWRAVHAYYKLDPDFRAAHQQHPWIIMWDNHDLGPGLLGSDGEIFSPGIQAFYEWTPVRDPEEFDKLYRTLQYGDLIEIILIDVDLFRDPQEDPFGDEIDDEDRSILGEEQLAWLKDELLTSEAKWRLICSQKPMGQWHLFGLPDLLPQDLPGINDFGFPFTNSTWDGYPAERREIYEFMRDNDINNNIALSGDMHTYLFYDMVENPWNPLLYNVGEGGGFPVGAEFVPGSISRGNMDEKLSASGIPVSPSFADLVESLIKTLNPHNVYMDFVNHGYGILDFREAQVRGEFWFSDILSRTDEERLDGSFACLRDRNRWERQRYYEPLTPLNPVDVAPAPFEEFDWEVIEGIDLLTSVESTVTESSNWYHLSQPSPNPAIDRTYLKFRTERPLDLLEVKLYDLSSGALLADLYSGKAMSGHDLIIPVQTEQYQTTRQMMVVFRSEHFILSRKVILVR